MELAITARHLDLTPNLRDHATRRLGFTLGRFAHRIRRVVLRLEDVNGPKGGRDVACHATAQLEHGGELHVAGMWMDPRTAISAGLERLRAAVTHHGERLRAHRR